MAYGMNQSITEGNIAKSLFFFSLPMLLGNVLQTLNGTINSIWIGKYLGESAFAATSNANNVLFLLISSIFGIGMAGSILIAQSIGAKNMEQSKRVVGTSALFFLLLSIFIGLIGFIFSPAILQGMHTPPDAMEYAVIYLRIIFIGVPFIYLFNMIMVVLRGAGDSKTPFYFLLISTFLDIVLNPVFIFGIGPFPKLGIAGSATATDIAQFVSLICIIVFLYRKKHFLRLTRGELHYVRFNGDILLSMIRKGIPMGLQMIIVSTSAIALINLVNTFGSLATAAYGAAMQIAGYVQMPAMAIGGAVSTVAAQNVGAGRWDRVHLATIWGIVFNVVMTGFLVAIIYLFNHTALGLFLQGEDAMKLGTRVNALTLWSFILFGVMFVVAGVVRSTGAVTVPLLISFLSLWVIRIPLAYYLKNHFGLDGIWWTFPVSFSFGMIGASLYYVFGNWRSAKMLLHQTAPQRS